MKAPLRLYLLVALALAAGMLLNLGVQPFFLEEPRRAFIAMELLANGNCWFPTQLGLPYFNKPPLFNWALIAAARLGGGFGEFPLRMVTVLSTWGIALLLGRITARQLSLRAGLAAGLLWLAAGGILFYLSMLAEIDLFYALITYAGFVSVFHFSQKEQWTLLFLTAYGLAALGMLTKGLPSIVFLGLTLGSWLIYQGKWKKLFHPGHLAGILLFGSLIGGYLWQYQQAYPVAELLQKLWSESANRTAARNSVLELLTHLLVFPLNFWVDLLPGSLLVVFLIRKDLLRQLRKEPWVAFSALTLVVNVLVYWISPGTRMRYVYMLYPLALTVLVWAFYTLEHKRWQWRTFRIGGAGLLLAIASTAAASYWVDSLQFLAALPLIAGIGAALGFAIFILFLWRPQWSLPVLLMGFALGRILFDLTVLPQRAHDSNAQREKEVAYRLHELTAEYPLYIRKGDRLGFTATYYLDRLRKGRVLRSKEAPAPGEYFLQRAGRKGTKGWREIEAFPKDNPELRLWYAEGQ